MGLKDRIEPLKNDPLRFIKIKALTTTLYSDSKIEIQNMSFLFESEDSSFLGKIIECQDKFAGKLNITKLRSIRHHDKLQPILGNLGINEESDIDREFKSDSDLDSKIGVTLTGSLINETNQMYEYVDETLELISSVSVALRRYAVKTFPNEKFS